MSFYAGVGSRKTPPGVLAIMVEAAQRLAAEGFILRSGCALGADQAFQRGAYLAPGKAQLFLPHEKFHVGPVHWGWHEVFPAPSREAYQIASRVHPAWEILGEFARAAHARNAHQILGPSLDEPVRFVICWTPDGAESDKEVTRATGGTGTAIRLAGMHGIPVVNLGAPGASRNAKEVVKDLLRWT